MSMTAAVRPWTPQAIDLEPPLPSTMVASASGMMVAANITQPSEVRRTRGHETEDDQPRCDVADALDAQVGAGGSLAEIWLHTVAGGGDARRDDESCADEDDAHADESGERVADGGGGHVETPGVLSANR